MTHWQGVTCNAAIYGVQNVLLGTRAGLTLRLGKFTLVNTGLDGPVELVVEDGGRHVVEVAVVVLDIFLDGLATIAKIVLAVRLASDRGAAGRWSSDIDHRAKRTQK